MSKATAADLKQGFDDIESGLCVLDDLVHFIENAKILADDRERRDEVRTLAAILAMAQKAGGLIERGLGLAQGDGLGNGAGIIGSAEAWITDPITRRARQQSEAVSA